jgi:hypothetical protein
MLDSFNLLGQRILPVLNVRLEREEQVSTGISKRKIQPEVVQPMMEHPLRLTMLANQREMEPKNRFKQQWKCPTQTNDFVFVIWCHLKQERMRCSYFYPDFVQATAICSLLQQILKASKVAMATCPMKRGLMVASG